MKKFKVNIDRPRPTSDEILSRRNFDGLMKQYAAAPGKVIHKPFWKSGWVACSLAVAAAVSLAVIIYVNKKDVNSAQQNNAQPVVNANGVGPTTRQPDDSVNGNNFIAQQKRRITPPLKGVEVPFSDYKVNASKGGTIRHFSGSKLTFPANAFVDAGGNAVTGDVQIRYREFHDQVDFFLSGIPMQYDSAGTTYQFESAGMMEISAFVNGKVVYLKKDKPVKVDLCSDAVNGSNFNIYSFDTLAGNWNYLGKDIVQAFKNAANNTNNRAKKITPKQFQDSVASIKTHADEAVVQYDAAHVVPDEPLKPIKANKVNNRFTVDYNPQEFPELASYKDVVWEVDESGSVFDRHKFYTTTWEDMKISRGTSTGKYVLTLTKGLDIEKLNVYPVLDGKNFDEAMKIYQQRYNDYITALNTRKKGELDARQTFMDRYAGSPYYSALNGSSSNYYANNPLADSSYQEVNKVINSFTISGFGVYNCDSPQRFPTGAVANVVLTDEKGNSLTGMTSSYLVDKNRKGLYSIYGNPVLAMSYDPQSYNLIWAVKDAKLYYCEGTDFIQPTSTSAYVATLKLCDEQFATPDEMKTFFRIGQKSKQ